MNNKDLKKILDGLIPAINTLPLFAARRFLDRANDSIAGTPFYFLLTGDGVVIHTVPNIPRRKK